MSEVDDGYPYDDEEPEDPFGERCPECGAWPEEWHEWDCSRGDCDDDDPADCSSPNHPGCRKCEVNPLKADP